MTPKETIEWLTAIEEKYIHGDDDGFDHKRRTAILMAKNALLKNANESMSMENRFRRCVQELIDIAKESECPFDIFQQVADEFAKAARTAKGDRDDR